MNLDHEFPQDENLLYLNHAAVSPWPRRTAAAVTGFALENVSEGARHYPRWMETEQQLREQLRTLINAPNTQSIALLKNTSEALSVVAGGIPWQPGDNVVSSNQEFPSNRIPWQARQKHGVEFREVELNDQDPEQALMDACDCQTRVLTVSSVQYGSGLKLDLERLGEFCRSRNIRFCIDAIQSIGARPLDVQACQADFVMADAHKWMLGPEGIALFYCRSELLETLELHQYGWHMVANAGNYDAKDWAPAPDARRFECGSPNMIGIHALSASLSLLLEIGMQTVGELIEERVRYLISELEGVNGLQLLTPADPARHAGIISFHIEGVDHAGLHKHLMQRQVICAHRFGGIRFSPHCYTGMEKIARAIDILKSAL